MKVKLPPKYVIIPADVLYDATISHSSRMTYCLLRGLAWEKSGKETPVITWDNLERVIGKDQKTIYNHLAELVTAGRLRYARPQPGCIVVWFTDPNYSEPNHCAFSENLSNNLDTACNKEEDTHSESIPSSSLFLDSSRQSIQKSRKSSGISDNSSGPSIAIPEDLKDALRDLGVFEDVLPRVASKIAQGIAVEDIWELIDQVEGQGKNPAAIFVHRLDNLTSSAKRDTNKDSNKYITGKYADFIDH
jgi:hypothetical protein